MKKYTPAEIESKWPHKKLTLRQRLPASRSQGALSRGKQYNPSELEKKWQKKWEESGIYKPNLDSAKKPFYNLMMFPYPSAEGLHVGNVYAFVGSDIYGRFTRMKGFDVFEPIGLDGFGIHSENYAIKVNKHPKEQAKISEENFYKQLHMIGNTFDWERKVETYDPDYYKWTQWIFTQLFKKGLAYRKKSPVNFCPGVCKTVLADEQVIDGKCERCATPVEKRDLEQWFFKITDYAEKLLDNLGEIDPVRKGKRISNGIDWSEKVKIAQRNWIGKSEGQLINFDEIKVFTTRPETMDGATFLVLSTRHPYIEEIKKRVDAQKAKEIDEYVQSHSAASFAEVATKAEKASRDKEERGLPGGALAKSGVFTGFYVKNSITNKNIPVWIADYVLMEYGTGAIMAVPAEDERDKEFAKKYKLPIIKSLLNAKPKGQKVINYHLRDWLISRQRYWGPPIPMVNCEKCGWKPVPEKNLPVILPNVSDWKPMGTGKSPLANIESFVNTTCPNCKGPAKRETDVSDTFLDSSWYFFRYISTEFDDVAFDKSRAKKWLPVHMYTGGAEHSVLHLLYARFITMVFKDMGLIDFEEPFTRFYAHGLLIKEGSKMSKSKGNVVVPDVYIKKYGADTLRTYLMFLGPFNQGGDFYDSGIEGVFRFINRVYVFITTKNFSVGEQDTYLKKLTDEITVEIENLRFNTAIARLMMYYNFLVKKSNGSHAIFKIEIINFIKMLAPFAPHLAEELYHMVTKDDKSIHISSWPQIDRQELENAWGYTIAIQINGKTRGVMDAEKKLSKEEAVERAKSLDNIKKHLEGKKTERVIYVEGKVINFVVN